MNGISMISARSHILSFPILDLNSIDCIKSYQPQTFPEVEHERVSILKGGL